MCNGANSYWSLKVVLQERWKIIILHYYLVKANNLEKTKIFKSINLSGFAYLNKKYFSMKFH